MLSGAQQVDAPAGDPTAPPVSPVKVATKSLLLGYQFEKLVRQECPSGPPVKAPAQARSLRIPATPRSSILLVPSVSALIHATLPPVPVDMVHRAERYDGKRDLHFLHAA